jgi:hypothetical protein
MATGANTMGRKNNSRARGGSNETSRFQSTATSPREQFDDESRLSMPGSEWHRAIGQAEGEALRGYAQIFSQHPLASLVVGFSAGFGIGVLLTAVFAQSERSWAERRFPWSLRDLSTELQRVPGMIASHLPETPKWR